MGVLLFSEVKSCLDNIIIIHSFEVTIQYKTLTLSKFVLNHCYRSLDSNFWFPLDSSFLFLFFIDPLFYQQCDETRNESHKEEDKENHKSFHGEFFLRIINKRKDFVVHRYFERNWLMEEVIHKPA